MAFSFIGAKGYTSNSVLSDGHWTKISTDTAGIFEVTYDQLINQGFANPEKVKIFGVGPLTMTDDKFPTGRIEDDLQPTYSINDPVRKKIFFYSPGTVSLTFSEASTKGITLTQTPYASRACFLLTDKDTPGYSPEKSDVNYNGEALADAHYSLDYLEYELRNPADGGAIMIGQNITAENPMEFTFEYRNAGGGEPKWTKSFLHLNFAGADFRNQTRAAVTPDPSKLSSENIRTSFSAIPMINDDAITFRPGSVDLEWTEMLDGPVTFTATPYGSTPPHFLAFDNAWTAYPRLSTMTSADAVLDMYFPGKISFRFFGIEGVSESLRVLDVTDHANIYEPGLQIAGQRAVGMFPTNMTGGCHLIAFNPDLTQRTVTFEGQATNTNLHGARVPEMLIITTSPLYESACALAEIHSRTDGLDCIVALEEDIFNEFGMGNRDAMAYRRAVKMFYDKDPERFRNVLLYGPGHWDNRGLLDGHSGEMLLTYQSKDPIAAGHKTRNFGADAYFGMVSNPKASTDEIPAQLMDVAVGRIPVADPVSARLVNAKIERYLTGPWPASLYTKVLVTSDDGNQNVHYSQAENTINVLRQSGRPFTVIRAHNLLYDWDGSDAKTARNLIINSLKDGVGLMTYTGHGSPSSFTGEMMWSRTSILSTDHDFTPFAFLSTCDALEFDRDGVGIGETMLLKGDGGTAGVIGAGRTVYSPYNYELSVNLNRCYSMASPGTTIGEIWKDGRNETVSARQATSGGRYNTMCYNLCGDPSLPILVPERDVIIDVLDDHQPSDVTSLSSRRPVLVKGHIAGGDRDTDTDFNGTINISVFDTPLAVSTKPRNPSTDAVLNTVLDHNVLFSKSVEVADGHFSTSIVLPDPSTESDTKASDIIFAADNSDGKIRATGFLSDIRIVADGQTTTDVFTAPVIESLSVDGKPTVGFTLTAEGTSGGADINTSTTSIGMSPFVTIDPETKGETRLTVSGDCIVWNNDRWTLTRPLPALAPGRHSLRLSLTDNVGNRVRAEHAFVVESSATFTLEADSKHPALSSSAQPTFHLTGDDVSVASSRLVVRDLRGKTCQTIDNPSFPYTLSIPSQPLTTGLYEVYATGTTSDGTPFSTTPVTIAVVEPVTQ